MLAQVSKTPGMAPDDVDLDFSLVTEVAQQDFASVWFGHPLALRGVLRDGTHVTLALNMTECAQIFLAMQDDAVLRGWAETMQVMRGGIHLS